ncbi:filamentous hemagglutinin N-terminal domain-containing protein, partial [Avibacterium endocarditidis]|uniref:two-partner secretion domain-containing protein n=1 Tax=Avibacterium endocarditidis TaxID=380674 RepID=UPI0039F108A0
MKSAQQLSLISLAILSSTSLAAQLDPNALPKGHQIVQGEAQINTQNNAMTIKQNSDRVSINWDSFDIGRQASVEFQQPSSSSIAYNRVTGADVSTIQGKLSANGRVFLANPNGIIFTKDAQVNVGAILATTKDVEKISEKSRYGGDTVAFTRKKQQEGEIINQVTINAQDAIILLGDKVKNHGTLNLTGKASEKAQANYWGELERIQIQNKTVLLATGENFTLDLDNFNVVLTGNEMASLIENDGVILSNDRIELTAKGKEMAKDIAINNNGILEANSIAIEGGKILLGNNSDIRYGKNHTSGAELTITQVGKAEGDGVKISGKITALTNVKKANVQNNQYNNRFKKNELALDEKGDVYYTDSDYTLKTAKKVDQGLQSADGNLYIYQKNGMFEILAKGAYQDYQASAGGAELASNLRKPALQMAYQKPILTINYLEKENNVSNVETHLGTQLDPVNAKIAEQIKAQIDAGNLVFLKPDEISKIASQVIEEQKNALLAKTNLSENELKTQLNGNLSSITVGNETHKREGLIFTEKLQQFAQELDQKNQVDTSHSTTFDDLKLLASLLDRTASFGENREATQTAYVSADKKTLKVVRVDEKLADKLQRKLALPLTTIQADSAINIENTTFT